jgi:hypothetical protein
LLIFDLLADCIARITFWPEGNSLELRVVLVPPAYLLAGVVHCPANLPSQYPAVLGQCGQLLMLDLFWLRNLAATSRFLSRVHANARSLSHPSLTRHPGRNRSPMHNGGDL